jgi:O-antigen/teichoic acid export membrane protein
MTNSRTNNVIKNSIFAIITQVINLILSFITRTIFIRILGSEILGLNGLITNILVLLSVAEMGFDTAISFYLYKHLVSQEKSKISALVRLFQKIYLILAIAVLLLGIAVYPLIQSLVEINNSLDINVFIVYILLLSNIVANYLTSYRNIIIKADQKNYLVNINKQFFSILQAVAQIVILLLLNNYYIYLIFIIVFRTMSNFSLIYKSNKLYPYLNELKIEQISKDEMKSIFSDIKNLFAYKIGSVILNGTDNILLTYYYGLSNVGIISNYVMVIAAAKLITTHLLNSFTASIGNLNALSDADKTKKIFYQILFINDFIVGYVAIGLLLFIDPFIVIWLGDGFVSRNFVSMALALYFYVNNIHFTVYTYRNTLGYFKHGKWSPLLAGLINIGLSILLNYLIGIAGIFLASSISKLITLMITDTFSVFKYTMKESMFRYFYKIMKYFVLNILIYLSFNYILSFVEVHKIFIFISFILAYSIYYLIIKVLVNSKNNNLRYLLFRIKKMKLFRRVFR